MEFYYLTNNKGSDNLNYTFLIFSQDLDIKLILNWANQQKNGKDWGITCEYFCEVHCSVRSLHGISCC